MNYEEKYKEALERAKELHGTVAAGRDFLAEIFPELNESEDERIRRMCISAVNIAASADGGLLHSEASECLSWLEEQKDKNCLACDQHLKGYLAGRKVTEEEKQKDIEDRWIEDRGQCFWDGVEEGKMLAEKQKEQKPAEWSDEDEKYLNRVINLWVNDFGEDSDTVKWLKSLRPSWKPSEEELAKKHLDGYCMGREDTLREMKDFVESHFTHREYKSPECGTCASAWNTASGTSTLKAEG